MHRKRQSLWVMLLLPVLLLWQGCGESTVKPETPGTITLELWTLQLSSFANVIDPQLQAFESAHPGVNVRWVDVPFSQGEKRTLTAMLSPTVPDVVNLNPDFAALLAARGALVDMATAIPRADQTDYLAGAWEACTLLRPNHAPLTFGLPWYLTSSVQLVNERRLRQVGRTEPPQSLEELLALSAAWQGGEPGFYLTFPYLSQSGGFLKALYQHGLYQPGQSIVDALNQPETLTFLQQWVHLYKLHALPAEAVTDGPQAAVDRYQSGGLVSFNIGANFIPIIRENAPSIYDITRVAPQFPAATKHPLFATMLLAVPQQSRHPELAVALAQYLTSTSAQLALAQAAPVLPSTVAGLKAVQSWQPNTRPHPQAQPEDALITMARQQSAVQLLAAQHAYPALPNQKAIHQWADHYTQAALLGTLTPAQALHNMAAAIAPLEATP